MGFYAIEAQSNFTNQLLIELNTFPEGKQELAWHFILDEHRVVRKFFKKTAGTSTTGKQTDIPYDTYQHIHRVKCHVDVNNTTLYTSCESSASIWRAVTNMAFIRNPKFTVAKPTNWDADNPSTEKELVDITFYDFDWKYKVESAVAYRTDLWLILDTTIVDNHNGSSTISFELEKFGAEYTMSTEIDRIGPLP